MKAKLMALLLILALGLAGCELPSPYPAQTTLAPTTPGPVSTPAATTTPPATPPESTPVPTPESTPEPTPVPTEPADGDFVKIADHIPGIFIDLPYATADNFTGQVIYPFTQPWLRYSTVKKLALVQAELEKLGYSLKIWDGYRPISAQEALWNICPDPVYVSNPYSGNRSHCRGNTVDLTLVHLDGSEVEMPTGFDDFSKQADRDYSDCTPEAAKNARLLEDIMQRNGFKPYSGEWWHFTDTQSYPIEETFQPRD